MPLITPLLIAVVALRTMEQRLASAHSTFLDILWFNMSSGEGWGSGSPGRCGRQEFVPRIFPGSRCCWQKRRF